MIKIEGLNFDEAVVLNSLSSISHPEERCVYFRHLEDATLLDRSRVRLACRSLTDKGLAMFFRGLMTEEGMCAGAGYCITNQGLDLIYGGPNGC